MLDTICQNYYGHLNGTVEAVLDANQGLADEVQPFRAGVVINLPDLVVSSEEGGDVVELRRHFCESLDSIEPLMRTQIKRKGFYVT